MTMWKRWRKITLFSYAIALLLLAWILGRDRNATNDPRLPMAELPAQVIARLLPAGAGAIELSSVQVERVIFV
jgi:hypothetical protein